MKKIDVVLILLSSLLSAINYLSTLSLPLTGIIFSVSLLYFFLIFRKRYISYHQQNKRYCSCFNFINNFIIALSVRESIHGAFENVNEIMDEEYKKEIGGLIELNDHEKLDYLKKFYKYHIYELFLDILNIYLDRGGDILYLSESLIEECHSQESLINETKAIGKKKLIEFITLWGFVLLILGVLRFALNDFYQQMSSSIIFQVLVSSLFLFLVLSVDIFTRKSLNLRVGGFDYQ